MQSTLNSAILDWPMLTFVSQMARSRFEDRMESAYRFLEHPLDRHRLATRSQRFHASGSRFPRRRRQQIKGRDEDLPSP